MNTLISRLRSRLILTVVGVTLLLLAGVFSVVAWWPRGSTAVATREVVNTAGGYSFQTPDGWSTTQAERTTTVTSPDRTTVITIGLGRTGSLPIAGANFFQQVGGNYRDVQVLPPQAKDVGPLTALVYGGLGTNAQNTRIRFLAITIEHDPINYAITVFTDAGSDPKVVLPQVNRVVDTFRVTPPR